MNELKDIDSAILCGGLGKRLRSAIGESQKVMAQVNDEPFLNILLKSIAAQGGKHVVLLTGYKSDSVEKYYREKTFGLKIDFSKETEPLGTGGALKNAHPLITSDPFIMMNGDSFCELDLTKLVEFQKTQNALGVLAVREVEDAQDYGTVALDSKKKIIGFKEKVKNGKAYINAGVYCFSQKIFDVLPGNKNFSIERDVFPKLAGQGLYGCIVKKQFIDVGVPKRYNEAQKIFKRK